MEDTHGPRTVDDFVGALEAAGVDEEGQRRFHAALERQNPALHEGLLHWLGLSPEKRTAVIERSRQDAALLPE